MWALSEVREKVYNFQKLPLDKSHFITEVHGIGLKNIRKCAVKYGGDLDCIVKGSKFTLSVMVKS